ncbi:MAG: hypothetical protein WDN00_01485 [Limisphaerales bacterium]
MKRRAFKICAGISTAFFLIFVGLAIYAWTIKPSLRSEPYFPIFSGVKITATELWGGNVIFFNQEAPYTGSIVSLGDDGVIVNGCTGYGIYYRLIKDPARTDSWWTLMFSLWYPVVTFSILPLIFLIKKWHAAKPHKRMSS